MRAFASTLALALGLSALVLGSGSAAYAAPQDALVVTVVKMDGTPVAAGEVVPEGTQLLLRVQYQNRPAPDDLPGTTQTVQLGLNTTVNVGAPPAGNTAVTAITPNGNGFDFEFANSWGTIDQGILDIVFTVGGVSQTEQQDITWNAGGNAGSLTIVVKEDTDVLENIGSLQGTKAVSPSNLNSHVNVGPSPTDPDETVFLGLNASVIGAPLTYTLTVELPEGTNGDDYDISDLLPAGLSYVPGSFSSSLTTWDPNGWNREVTPLDGTTTPAAFVPSISGTGPAGQSFTGQIDLPDPSILTITYQATIADEASRVVVENAIRAQVPAGGASGNFTHPLTNSATFDGIATPRTATVNLTGTIPGPCTTGCAGAAFGKTGSGASVNVIADATGTIVDAAGDPAPVDVDYTLSANLSQWTGVGSNFTLDRNVVISDTLGSQLTWNTTPLTGDFITVTAPGTSPIQTLTQTTCPVGAATDPIATASANFNGVGYVGMYCVAGQRLLINVGMAQATDVSIVAKAQLHSVDGLTPSGTATVLGATRYQLPNQAQFWHRNGARSNADNNQYPVKLPDDRSPGLNDTDAFTKRGPGTPIVVAQGDRALVPYTFTVKTGSAGVSAADARIEDPIDTSVFDMSDLSLIGIASTYTTVGDVSGDVELSFTGGLLTIELDDAAAAALPAGGTWVVTLTIPTFPIMGKQTLDIYNYATLFGQGTEPKFWSDDHSRSTSFGNELEVRKHVFDRGSSDWTQVLVAPEDASGDLVDDIYVYRLQILAHGSFSGAILAITDVLPAAATFEGFVDEADVASGGPAIPSNTVTLAYGIQAAYNPAAGPQGEITLSQPTGAIPAGGEVAAYFAVRVPRDLSEIVLNSLSGSEARIIPGGPSIDIEKWIDEGATPLYDARGLLLNDGFAGDFDAAPGKQLTASKAETIRFTVSNDGPEPLVDVEVGDQLTSGSGTITGLVCTFPDTSTGTTWGGPFAVGAQFECEGTLPGLAAGQTHADTAWVTAIGERSGIGVNDDDAWHGHVPSALGGTGGQSLAWLAALAGLGIIGGGILLIRARRTEGAHRR